MRGGVVALGGDYLVEGDPNWACKACQSRWRAWPFSWPDDALVAADERRRMRVNPRPGAAGAGHGGGEARRRRRRRRRRRVRVWGFGPRAPIEPSAADGRLRLRRASFVRDDSNGDDA